MNEPHGISLESRAAAWALFLDAWRLAQIIPEWYQELDRILQRLQTGRGRGRAAFTEPYEDDGEVIRPADLVVRADGGWSEIPKSKSGCYAWKLDGEILRAGQSNDLRRRLRRYGAHENRDPERALVDFVRARPSAVIELWYVDDIDDFERRLIARFRPRFNAVGL